MIVTAIGVVTILVDDVSVGALGRAVTLCMIVKQMFVSLV